MYQLSRRLLCVLLALTLLLPAAATQAEPAAGMADRWLTSASDLLAGFLDGLLSIGSIDAASETDDGTQSIELDEGGNDVAPHWDPNGTANSLDSSARVAPSWDPNG